MSAYMLWLNSSRERIKSENPGISITEISKKAGEMWRQLGKEEKEVRRENNEELALVLLLWPHKTSYLTLCGISLHFIIVYSCDVKYIF